MVLPSQQNLTPEMGRAFVANGITSFMLGVVTTGDMPAQLEDTIREFVEELQESVH